MKVNCLFDKMVPAGELISHPKNRNTHPQDKIERLAKILEYQGFRYPIKVSKRSGFITSGHGRLLAALRNGWKNVPVNYQDYESDEQEYADVQADNAIASWAEMDLTQIQMDLKTIDIDFDLLGIKDFNLLPDENKDAIEDEVPEVTESISKFGDVYELGEHRLMCGDSTSRETVERLMNGEKADMVFTDPPYGMSVVKKDGNNNGLGGAIDVVVGITARGKYRPVIGDQTTEAATKCYQLCLDLDCKTMIFWGANFYAEALVPSSGWIVWDKENGEGFFADGELAWTNSDKQLRIFRHQWKGMIRESERGEKRVHPTQNPIALAEWSFKNYGDPKSVLDLFGGSGSTLIACEKTKRKCFMMELDPHYIDVIVSRYCKYSGNYNVKRNGEHITWPDQK